MQRHMLATGFFLIVPLLGLTAWAGQTPSPQDNEFFESKVRPLLAQRCYGCHSGPAPKGGLSLDNRAGGLRGGALGKAIVPGDPDNSLLIKAVRHTPGVPTMPPGESLSTQEIAVLAQWIGRGAIWPGERGKTEVPRKSPLQKHWAFQPIRKPSLPAVKNLAWCKTPIDRFILAKLEAKGLAPAPPADRRTLLRRVTYDLTGLPPTPAEVAAFLIDSSKDAYEKVVDRLLASSSYGERQARHWLDVVHYGDTHGYDKDKRRDHAWPYRDYVIAAFNQDKPYARFLKEQIAGDVLSPQEPEGIVATGFLAAGPWDFVGNVELAEGTVEKEKTRLIDRDDMVSTVMSTFCSMTVHCARCHDHKFDPIPQKDYYRLQTVFAGVDRGERPYANRDRIAQQAQLEKKRALLTAERDALSAHIRALTSPELSRLDREIVGAKAQLTALPLSVRGADSPTNGYHSAIAAAPDVTKWVQVDLGASHPLSEIRLLPARPTDFPDTPGFGFPVRYQVAIANDPAFADASVVSEQTRTDVVNPGDAPVVLRVSGLLARYVRITATRLWKRSNDYVFALAEMQVFSDRINVARGKTVTALDSIEQGRWGGANLVDNFDSRSALPDLSDPAVAQRVAQRQALETRIADAERARQAEVEHLTDAKTRTALARIDAELTATQAQIAALPRLPLVYSVVPHLLRPIFVLARGDVEQKGERIGPGALSCMPGLNPDFSAFLLPIGSEEGQARAALAEWIAAPQNMLTWRSIVNRVWHYHFSRGIVETPNDFGRNGALPTHPELLDWLAAVFVAKAEERKRQEGKTTKEDTNASAFACDQSLKKLHRLILLSAVYRQSALTNPVGAKVDADNHLLWRMNRRRLEAEEIRDSVLAASGKLDRRMGGPGFELFRFKDDHSPIYDFTGGNKVADPATFRRTVYQFIVRSVPDPFLDSLDSPDPSVLTPVRNTTLTALQSLALRNDPFMVQQADFFAERLCAASPSGEQQIERAYLLLFGRRPTEAERVALTDYAHKNGLADACRLLFNTNEFVFID